jgi:hypothetical protein
VEAAGEHARCRYDVVKHIVSMLTDLGALGTNRADHETTAKSCHVNTHLTLVSVGSAEFGYFSTAAQRASSENKAWHISLHKKSLSAQEACPSSRTGVIVPP